MTMAKGNIVFICGASHAEWCWEENFTNYFIERGYNINIHVLSKEARDVKNSVLMLEKKIKKLKLEKCGKVAVVTHSMGNLILNEYLTDIKNIDDLDAIILLSPYPTSHRFLNSIKISCNYYGKTKEELFFSGRVDKSKEYIEKMEGEAKNNRLLTLTYSKVKFLNLLVPTLIIGSINDKCISVKSLIDNTKHYGATLKVYNELCHDCMLDPLWGKVAADIYSFLQN
ncbi:MAG: hypothetical protein ACRDA4_10195 [Filifactoraceae bacterium]